VMTGSHAALSAIRHWHLVEHGAGNAFWVVVGPVWVGITTARGSYELPVIKALESQNVSPSAIAGIKEQAVRIDIPFTL